MEFGAVGRRADQVPDAGRDGRVRDVAPLADPPQIAEAIATAVGRPIRYVQTPWKRLRELNGPE